MHPSIASLLSFFRYEHLPPHMQAISKAFAVLAHELVGELPDAGGTGVFELDGAEATAGLRKLLEAKDCFVRAALVKELEARTTQSVAAP